jgi:hypothetical protein
MIKALRFCRGRTLVVAHFLQIKMRNNNKKTLSLLSKTVGNKHVRKQPIMKGEKVKKKHFSTTFRAER